MAPIFVLLEVSQDCFAISSCFLSNLRCKCLCKVLFFLGYKRDFRDKVQVQVDQSIREWKEGKAAPSSQQPGFAVGSSASHASLRRKSQKAL